jgi:hypothetical protein
MDASASAIGPVALSVLILYGVSVAMFDVPTPPKPWSYVLAAVLTALFLPWLVLEARVRWATWRSTNRDARPS